MKFVRLFVVFGVISFSNSHESNSAEVNGIEFSPFYDTIIFSDVIDIINELNKNLNSPFDDDSESESDENIDDLLTEYQHYLDKAHEQRRLFLEKTNKTKNKVPLLRHESFVKTSVPIDNKYNNLYTHNIYNPSVMKMPATSFNSPLDFFIPLNPTMRYFNKPDRINLFQTKDTKGEKPMVYDRTGRDEKKPLYTLPPLHKPINGLMKSSCFCKPNELPCKCNCKQCLISINENDAKLVNPDSNKFIFSQNPLVAEPKLSEHMMEDIANKANTLNVRIKVDVQLPKMLDNINKYRSAEFDDFSKEFSSGIRLPSTYFNFPIPMDLFGYKKVSKANRHESPLHKITIHKKKKSRSGNGNSKKHRKKLITFHNIKLSPSHTLKPIMAGSYNMSNTTSRNEDVIRQENTTVESKTTHLLSNFTGTVTEPPASLNITTQVDESIYFMVNISNNSENEKEDVIKTGNSIEIEYKTISNTTTETPLNIREKRDTMLDKTSDTIKKEINPKLNNATKQQLNVIPKSKTVLNVIKKSNRSILPDAELLYWPSNIHNQSGSHLKDITDIILEQENKKAKLNMTTEAIRHNRTMALEKAIFGNVDWNDVDTVAPTFISFVGKYINGILTFCSEKICHSMKCYNKTCVHRTCVPELRYNNYGHCGGCNKTDSVASMESIMDLPSNVAFEIVDILQDKMIGKLYGKVTLCINSKCSSFIASKKTFIKFKCLTKNLNDAGHCPNIKKS